MRISYLVGDATRVEDPGPHVIAHICNDSGGWGKGFVLAISRRWRQPEAAYRQWAKSGHDFGLGMVQVVNVGDDVAVANMVAQHGYRSASNPVAVRYEALDTCLLKLAERLAAGTTVQMPRIGCGLAGGQWEKIEPLIQSRLVDNGYDVTRVRLPGRRITLRPEQREIHPTTSPGARSRRCTFSSRRSVPSGAALMPPSAGRSGSPASCSLGMLQWSLRGWSLHRPSS